MLQQLKADSDQAFVQLFNYHKNIIYGTALRFLKSQVLAEEVVLDVFMKLWLKRKELDKVKRLDAYLFVMARNYIFDRMKKLAYENDHQASLEMNKSLADETEYLVRQHECQQFLQEAIEMLPPQQRQVYNYVKSEGMSHDMIAQRMQLSRHTVKKHMAMALKTIRAYLEARLN